MSRGPWTPLELARLRARSEQLASFAKSELDRDASCLQPTLIVGVGSERCAIPTTIIHAVARLKHLAPLPGTPPDVAGLVAWSGEILAAFQMRTALALPLSTLPESASVVVVGRVSAEAGIIVDTLEGTRTLDLAGLGAVPERFSARGRRLVRGIAPGGVPVLDGDALLDSDALYVASPRMSA